MIGANWEQRDKRSTIKQIFDAKTVTSRDGCDPDWCHEVLQNASPADVRKVEEALRGRTENEAAKFLGVMN